MNKSHNLMNVILDRISDSVKANAKAVDADEWEGTLDIFVFYMSTGIELIGAPIKISKENKCITLVRKYPTFKDELGTPTNLYLDISEVIAFAEYFFTISEFEYQKK